MKHLFPDPRPVAPMSLAEAWRLISDAQYADGFDPTTRAIAWKMAHAARRVQCPDVAAMSSDRPLPPKDAA